MSRTSGAMLPTLLTFGPCTVCIAGHTETKLVLTLQLMWFGNTLSASSDLISLHFSTDM